MQQTAGATHQTMAKIGATARNEMATAFAAFDAIGLAASERLSAIAGVIAATAAKRHAVAPTRLLGAIQDMMRPAIGRTGEPCASSTADARPAQIADGVRVLDTALDRLAQHLTAAGLPGDEAAFVERVFLARLLSAYRPQAIRTTLLAVGRAGARPGYCCGDPVHLAEAEAVPAADVAAAT
ncbi:MAG TPA: hypothetical protein VGD08_17360 [Stellaceae bacterium]